MFSTICSTGKKPLNSQLHINNMSYVSVAMRKLYYITRQVKFKRLTFPPWAPRTAKQKSVDGEAFPGMENCEKAAAWPSIGWLTLRSTEYSCIAPTTRFVCAVNRPTSDGI